MATIYDHAGSLRRMGDDLPLFREMASLLRTDAPHWLSVLNVGLRTGDCQKAERAAHTLKGLAANFGAERAVAAAAAVERLAKAQQLAGLPPAVEELDAALDELIAALDEAHRPTLVS